MGLPNKYFGKINAAYQAAVNKYGPKRVFSALCIFFLVGYLTFFFFKYLFSGYFISNESGDIFMIYLGYFYYIKESFLDFILPLWNPYVFSGTSLISNPEYGLFYPLNLLFIPFGIPYAFNITIIVHFLIKGIGASLLLESWTLIFQVP